MGRKVKGRNAHCFVAFPLAHSLLHHPHFITTDLPPSPLLCHRHCCSSLISLSLPFPLSPSLPCPLSSGSQAPLLALTLSPLAFPRSFSPLPSLSNLTSSPTLPCLASPCHCPFPLSLVLSPSPRYHRSSLFSLPPPFPLSLFPLPLSPSSLAAPTLFPSPPSPPSPHSLPSPLPYPLSLFLLFSFTLSSLFFLFVFFFFFFSLLPPHPSSFLPSPLLSPLPNPLSEELLIPSLGRALSN